MNTIRVVGQVITSTNYTTTRLFNFSPKPIKEAAENFLASGITELEIPQAVLDPDNRFPEKGIDKETLRKTIELLPSETRMIGSYFKPPPSDADNAAYIAETKRTLDYMIEYFPHFRYAMMHPPKDAAPATVDRAVTAWAELAEYASRKKADIQLCLHNHYDSGCETAEQVSAYLERIRKADCSALKWGPDTGHCHGMGARYLEVFEEYASLIGNHFHIKARAPAFDQLHGGNLYDAKRDLWGNKAEFGRGLYGGFVNCADPEIQTPFAQVFSIIREKAQPTDGIARGAMEIDIPRQHPRIEILCAVLYLKRSHGIETEKKMTYQEIVESVFGK